MLKEVRGARMIVNEENIGYLRSVNAVPPQLAGDGWCCVTTTSK